MTTLNSGRIKFDNHVTVAFSFVRATGIQGALLTVVIAATEIRVSSILVTSITNLNISAVYCLYAKNLDLCFRLHDDSFNAVFLFLVFSFSPATDKLIERNYILGSEPETLLLSNIKLPHPSNRQQLSCDYCLEYKRQDYRNCSVLCCVPYNNLILYYYYYILYGVLYFMHFYM